MFRDDRGRVAVAEFRPQPFPCAWPFVAAFLFSGPHDAPGQPLGLPRTPSRGNWTADASSIPSDASADGGWPVRIGVIALVSPTTIADTVEKENIAPGTLTLHADRGTSMRSKGVAALLIDLDVAKTHSRPHVSDDNPYSEAQFKTLKYRPDPGPKL